MFYKKNEYFTNFYINSTRIKFYHHAIGEVSNNSLI